MYPLGVSGSRGGTTEDAASVLAVRLARASCLASCVMGALSRHVRSMSFKRTALASNLFRTSSDHLPLALSVSQAALAARIAARSEAVVGSIHVGRGGFEAKARGLADARDAVVAFVRERVPELRLLADHDATCPAVVPLGLAPGSPVASVYAVAHHMAARGWNLPTGQKPACVSVLLAYQHAGPLLDALLADLRAAVDAAVAAPDAKLDGELAVYGAADAIPDELLDEACRLYVDVRMAVRGADVGKAAAGP